MFCVASGFHSSSIVDYLDIAIHESLSQFAAGIYNGMSFNFKSTLPTSHPNPRTILEPMAFYTTFLLDV
jgi:hypothetical protein